MKVAWRSSGKHSTVILTAQRQPTPNLQYLPNPLVYRQEARPSSIKPPGVSICYKTQTLKPKKAEPTVLSVQTGRLSCTLRLTPHACVEEDPLSNPTRKLRCTLLGLNLRPDPLTEKCLGGWQRERLVDLTWGLKWISFDVALFKNTHILSFSHWLADYWQTQATEYRWTKHSASSDKWVFY